MTIKESSPEAHSADMSEYICTECEAPSLGAAETATVSFCGTSATRWHRKYKNEQTVGQRSRLFHHVGRLSSHESVSSWWDSEMNPHLYGTQEVDSEINATRGQDKSALSGRELGGQ